MDKIKVSLPSKSTRKRMLESAILLFLALYPLRHIHIGLDMMDTGYDYANYRYMGLHSMDSMWLFSTYLSTAVGHFLTMLPGGHTLLGMNLYTGLFVSLLAVLAWFFCVHALKMPQTIAFLGEVVAISLCWCPTAVLYNYMTYLFLLIAVGFIYHGLTKNKNLFLLIAGVFLGLNVFVRFSNLPEVVLILAVWAMGILEGIDNCRGEAAPVRKREALEALRVTAVRTFYCIMGFVGAVLLFYLYLSIRYGFNAYPEAITRLLGMTEQAQDYTAGSMIYALFRAYRNGLYWFLRIVFFAICGVIICAICKLIDWIYGIDNSDNPGYGIFHRQFSFLGVAYFLSTILGIAAMAWLIWRKFTSSYYYSYDSIWNPGIVFLIIISVLSLQDIFFSKSNHSEKLVAGLVFLVIWITPLGSNNVFLPALNNFFLAAPYALWRLYKMWMVPERNLSDILRGRKDGQRLQNGFVWCKGLISFYPVRVTLLCFVVLCFVQFTVFGWCFVFSESTGVQNPVCSVGNSEVLEGIRMPREKAEMISSLQAFVEQENLTGSEVILFGQNPGLSFYLEMPAAFNPWPILDSYHTTVLKSKLETLIENGERPVVILDNAYLEGKITYDEYHKLYEEAGQYLETLSIQPKWRLLLDFMERMSYEQVYNNGRYSVYFAQEIVTGE